MNDQREKSPARQKLEEEVRLKDLARDLNTDLLPRQEPKQIVPITARSLSAQKVKKAIAIALLLAVIGLAILPAIGTGWTLFYFSLSIYLWQGFVGLAVVVGAIAAFWVLWVLLIKRL